MNKNFLRLLLNLCLAISFMAHSTFFAFANGNISITKNQSDQINGNNSWFIFESLDGELINSEVIIKNLSGEKTTVKVSALDSLPSKTGRFLLKNTEDEQENIGLWTQIESQELELNPFESKPLKFQISIPEGAAAGDYAGGIVVEEVQESVNGTNISTRIGNRIYLKIPGQIERETSWGEFEIIHHDSNFLGFPQISFRTEIENSGASIIRPFLSITVYNSLNNPISSFTRELGEISPNSSIAPEFEWMGAPVLGKYRIEAELKTPESTIGAKTVYFSIIPWSFIILFSLVVIIGITLINFFRKKNLKTNPVASSNEKI